MNRKMALQLFADLFRAAHSVRRGGEDTAGPAAALPAGVQPPDRGLAGVVPQQPHGRGTAAFHGGKHGVRLVVAFQLPPQNRQGFRQRFPQVTPGR